MTGRVPTASQEPVSATSFATLIRKARRRDEEALATLYQRALPVIYRYVLARLGRPDLVEDVVSEVFLVMVESITDLRAEHEAGFFAWMIQIAQGKISRAIRHLKRQATYHASFPGSPADEGQFLAEPMANDLLSDPAALQEWRETLQELGLALGSLSAEQQVVVIGRFLAGQSIEDLARALGKQPGAVRALQFRALGALAERLGLGRSERSRSKGGRA
ncbi:MAG TPA: sigma-70 family RNA polymerase sigma factor [Ktedonobacterales bacterium]|jgi:RNA polymerase sigma-70 factor (ECF subfamily)